MSSTGSQSLKCVYCDMRMEPTVVHRGLVIRGWRCPRCGFTLIHPKDASKAIDALKEAVRV